MIALFLAITYLHLADGTSEVRVEVTSPVGVCFRVETSVDLVNWQASSGPITNQGTCASVLFKADRVAQFFRAAPCNF